MGRDGWSVQHVQGLGKDIESRRKIRTRRGVSDAKLHRAQGLVAPMDRENVDTDAIIPKQFLKSIKRTGFGPNLFDAWRYLDPGEPGKDPATRRRIPTSC